MFNPTEIIFSSTTACNLHCEHCFVSRNPNKLSIDDAKAFILSCKNAPESQIDKIGFSGGEPFLYPEFLIEITKFAVSHDFMFDQIMTNGDWWQNEKDLRTMLQKIYDAGYDGKIGLSWDAFHAQKQQRMEVFIHTVQEIFGPDSINIQTVISDNKDGGSLPLVPAVPASTTPSSGDTPQRPVQIFYLPQTFPSEDSRAWKARRWFKDDYCAGPGNILYIHSDGNIAPCCGFANENTALFIGKITDTYQKVMENARENQLIKICFETGLGKYRKLLKRKLRKQGKKFPGKCNDLCSFCDFVCNLKENLLHEN